MERIYICIDLKSYQVTKDSCDCCLVRMGFDYLITRLSNVQKRNFSRIRTLESEVANG